jgi:hypothetical protein
MLTADKALDDDANTFAHTEMGRGHWWMPHSLMERLA